MTTRPRAVLLDSLGTLVRLEDPAARLRAELARRGVEVSEESAVRAFRAEIAWYLEHHVEGSDRSSLERLRDGCARVMRGELGTGSHAAVREAMLASLSFSAFPDAAPALRALRGAGLRVAVASNWDCSLPEVLDRVNLLGLVDAVVTSAGAGAPKPAAPIFRRALDAVGVEASSAACVGDSADNDVAGALALGIPAILLDRDAAAGGARADGERGEDGSEVPVARSLGDAASLILARR